MHSCIHWSTTKVRGNHSFLAKARVNENGGGSRIQCQGLEWRTTAAANNTLGLLENF
jgi:hypothetical protein